MIVFLLYSAQVEGCPSFENADSLTQTQLFKRLTHPCRFDRIQRPERKLSRSLYGK